jgi:predicted regulator of Ras-like GTPase activity (Roadblock/LC7/MglB family)/tetratricopeptide (TPR) repeat protein
MAEAGMAEIEELKKKLALNPESLIFVPLADAYRKAAMYSEAIEVCKAGLDKHPSYTSARVVLGRIYTEKDMVDEAIEELKKVESIDIDNIMVHSMLGNAYLKKKMYAQAIEQFQRVLSLNPEDTETQDKLQEALSAKQVPSERAAKAEVKEEPKKEEVKQEEAKPKVRPEHVKITPAAEAKPASDLSKTLKVAELYLKKEEFDKSIEIYREILESDSENIIVQQRLREVYDLQQKKLNKQKEKTEKEKEKKREIETDKITAEDILDVMKEAVENDRVEEERAAAPEETMAEDVYEPQAEPKAEEEKAPEVRQEAEQETIIAPVAEEQESDTPEAEKEVVEKKSEIDDNKKKEVENILKVMSAVDGIVGTFFLMRDGSIIASVLPKSINSPEIGSIVASIVEKTEKSVRHMNQGKLNQVVIASEHGQLLFTEIGSGVIFMIGNEDINVGKMGLMLKNVIEKIKKVL